MVAFYVNHIEHIIDEVGYPNCPVISRNPPPKRSHAAQPARQPVDEPGQGLLLLGAQWRRFVREHAPPEGSAESASTGAATLVLVTAWCQRDTAGCSSVTADYQQWQEGQGSSMTTSARHAAAQPEPERLRRGMARGASESE